MLRRVLIAAAMTAGMVMAAPNATAAEDDGYVSYEGYHLVRAYPRSWDQIKTLRALGVKLFGCHEGVGPVDYLVPPDTVRALDLMQIRFELIEENVQDDIEAERRRLAEADPAGPRDDSWFEEYKDFDQIVAKMNAMAADRPDLVTILDIGDSIEGRDIWAMRITGPGDEKPAVLYNGTQHAREWVSPMVNMWIADKLVYEYDTNPEIQALVDDVEFFIVPVVNPDGYVYSWGPDRMWRKNRRVNDGTSCRGVDPNRNWGFGWGGEGASSNPCDQTYRGPSAFSEPETQALRDFFIANPQIVSNIDFHSYSQLILSPFGYTNEPPEDNDTFLELGEAMHDAIMSVHGEFYEWGPIYSTIYPASGGSVDWVYGDQGIFSFTIELRPDSFWEGGFELPPDEIIPTCEENMAAVMYLSEWSSSPVNFSFPSGLPAQVDSGDETVIDLNIRVFAGPSIEPGTEAMLYRFGSSGPFAEQALTPMGDSAYQAVLPALESGESIEFYFEAETTGGDVYRSPSEAPDDLYTAGAVDVVYEWDLSSDPGWQTQGLWGYGQPTGGGGQYGGPDPDSGFTGPNVYGYNLNGDYENDLPERHLTTTAIDCTGLTNVELQFRRWLGVEQPAYDHAYVRVSNDGTSWTTIWQNTSEVTDSSWQLISYDISDVADDQETVYVRWTMGETDVAWQYCGWNIDDVKIRATTPSTTVGDLDGDGDVDVEDLLTLLADWGPCEGCPADLDGNGAVDVSDLLALLANWG